MKMSELVQRTGVPKETIHYYLREGLLPKPKRLSRNSAEYSQAHLDRLQTIKDLQDRCFLPLSVIKKILKTQAGSPEGRAVLDVRSSYFRPVDQLMTGTVRGEKEFLEATGFSRKRLAKFEEWGIISPHVVDGEKVYSQDELALAKVILDMDRLGMGPKDGFAPETLRVYAQMFEQIVDKTIRFYFEGALNKLKPEELSMRWSQGREVTALFFFHLFRKLAGEKMDSLMEVNKTQSDQTGD